MSLHDYTVQEVLNKVMIAADSALRVTLDNVTITDANINVRLSEADDSVQLYGNNGDNGAGTNKAIKCDSNGLLIVQDIATIKADIILLKAIIEDINDIKDKTDALTFAGSGSDCLKVIEST